MKQLSIGKYRALQRASTANGVFTVLAIDHLDSLRRAMKPDNPNSVSDAQITAFKQDVVGNLQNDVSGVLLDPVYGAAQAINSGLPKATGLLVELEKADYDMNPLPLAVDIRPDWSVEKIKRMGADGVKLFYYYDPDNAELCRKQDETLNAVIADCASYDIPLYAEPIMLDVTPDNRFRKILTSAERAVASGVDILKLEFPVDVSAEDDLSVWQEACQKLSSLGVPWVLLSAGVDFETYCKQVKAACEAGASGFMVGRAVWGDVANISNTQAQQDWLTSIGVERIQRLVQIAETHATSWKSMYQLTDITPDWHRNY